MTARMKFLFMVGFVLVLMGCNLGGKPSIMVEQYALEYPPPAIQSLSSMDTVIRLERFSVAQIFNHVKMVYRQKPTQYNDYAYHRWRANPGDMVSDSLLRDLRAAGVFKMVLSYRDMENTPLILKGGVGEFYESDEKDGRRAILSVHIALMDMMQKELTKQILFQKNYRYDEPLTEQTVQGFAQAMSRAMEKFSRQVITDLREGIKKRE